MSIINLVRGDDLSFDLIVTRDGQPFPITPGTDVIFMMKSSTTDPDSKAIRKSIGYGVTIVDPVASRIRISLLPADTMALPNVMHIYQYGVKVADIAGNVFTVLTDFIKIIPGVNQQPFSTG